MSLGMPKKTSNQNVCVVDVLFVVSETEYDATAGILVVSKHISGSLDTNDS